MENYTSESVFHLESGNSIEGLNISYTTYGSLNRDQSNVIWVCHAISGDTKVLEWWPQLFGSGKMYDPQNDFIICTNCIGSPYGSTKPEDLDFPTFTIRDIVSAQFLLAESLGIRSIRTLIGGSFGGYQALEFAYAFQGEIDHIILLASSAKESAWGIAIHETQRIALNADPSFGEKGGGLAGLKAARAIGMLTYRTSENLIHNQSDVDDVLDDFKASSYINHHGHKFSEQFDALSLYYLTKCIDSHNIGRDRGGERRALQSIDIPTLVIGFSSDLLVPVKLQRFLAEHLPQSTLVEMESEYGHDGFLLEGVKITESIKLFCNQLQSSKQRRRVVLKFGGSSLYGSENVEQIINLIKGANKDDPLAIVVSARGKSTDRLMELYEHARQGHDYLELLDRFKSYLSSDLGELSDSILGQIRDLAEKLKAIKTLRIGNRTVRDSVLAFGELISAMTINERLESEDLKSIFVDARLLIHVDLKNGEPELNFEKSKTATLSFFNTIATDQIPIITGYIAQNELGHTVTLGRNGSNYSASLIASFIHAREVQNWTDVQGVYSGDPRHIPDAVRIENMCFSEANEMANFGMNLLHPKTIAPLMRSNIPLHIRCLQDPSGLGTLIDAEGGSHGVKSVTSIKDVSLITIVGNQKTDKIGLDTRIFSCLKAQNIPVRMISQASSGNEVGFVIASSDVINARAALHHEFVTELKAQVIKELNINNDVGIVVIIGRHNFALEKAISTLRKNNIWLHLINNSISGEHISLVVEKEKLNKATRLVHTEVFDSIKSLHLFVLGKGKVGSAFIKQVLSTDKDLVEHRGLNIKIIGIADSSKYIIQESGVCTDWKEQLAEGQPYTDLEQIVDDITEQGWGNLVFVDNTPSVEVGEYYQKLVRRNIDIVSCNKSFNSSSLKSYKSLRVALRQKARRFLYEANVGAGLPIISTLRSLYQSGDRINRIRGVFSGSLSYIFNTFSVEEITFSKVLDKAVQYGYAEPDPRADLEGIDVAKKLVILAREINYPAELCDVQVQNLIPELLRKSISYDAFRNDLSKLDEHYLALKKSLKPHEVLRYVAELDVIEGTLEVSLKNIDDTDPIALLKNADNYFEIYTDNYGDQPLVIQGAVAGPEVTARAVYADLLKLK